MYTNSKIGGKILKVYLRDFPFIKDQDIILGQREAQGQKSMSVKGLFINRGQRSICVHRTLSCLETWSSLLAKGSLYTSFPVHPWLICIVEWSVSKPLASEDETVFNNTACLFCA